MSQIELNLRNFQFPLRESDVQKLHEQLFRYEKDGSKVARMAEFLCEKLTIF